jgi:hypothetical protein
VARELADGGPNIVRALDIECIDFEAELGSGGLDFADVQGGQGIEAVSQHRQPAETGNDLPQNFEPFADKIGLLGRQAGDIAARSRQ